MDHHLADLRLALERMRRYGLKMNPLKYAIGVSAGKFLGFIIHEKGIEVDPKRIEAMRKVEAKVMYLSDFMWLLKTRLLGLF